MYDTYRIAGITNLQTNVCTIIVLRKSPGDRLFYVRISDYKSTYIRTHHPSLTEQTFYVRALDCVKSESNLLLRCRCGRQYGLDHPG